MKNMRMRKWLACVAAAAAISSVGATAMTGEPVFAKATLDHNSKIEFVGAENYGGKSDDSFKAVARTKDGGYVAVGYSKAVSTDPVWGNTKSSNGAAYNDGLVVKFNSEMEIEWAQNYGLGETDVLFDVDVLDNGTIVAAGSSYLFRKEENLGFSCAWVLMINPDDPGDYKELFPSGSKNDYLYGICALKNNEFAVFGYGYSSDAVWKNTTGAPCGIIVRYNSKGKVKFACSNNIGSQAGLEKLKRSRFYDGCVDQEGNLIAVGDVQLGEELCASQIVKFDGTTGKMIWGKLVGTTRTESPTDLSQTHISCLTKIETLADGSYVTVGYSTKIRDLSCDYVTDENLAAIGRHDSVILRYMPDGTCIHSELIGTLNKTVDLGVICPEADGGYFIGGSADSALIENYEKARGYTFDNEAGHDIILIRYDSDNKCVWSANYGGSGGDYINGMLIREDGHIVAVGEADSDSDSPKYGNNGRIDATAYASFRFGDDMSSLAQPNLVGSAESSEPAESDEGYSLGAPYEHRSLDPSENYENEETGEDFFFDSIAEEPAVTDVGAAGAELSDTYYAVQKQYFDKIGIPTFWERRLSGKGVTLAVIDSGFTPAHQDIDYSRVLPAIDCSGSNTDGGMTDMSGHGTGILGELIAIRDNNIGIAGILDEVTIAPIKVNYEEGETKNIEAAIYAAVDECHASVISMSFGDQNINTESLKKAIDYAVSKDVILVAAAGNGRTTSLFYPAAFDNVIGVGYVDNGLWIAPNSPVNESIDVVAPGTDICTTYPSVNTHCTVQSGSSFAAPMVAAMAAAAKQMNPDITQEEFLNLLRQTSIDRGTEGYDTKYGYGVVNFDAFAKKITFSDVLDPDKWYYDSVYWAYNNRITSGLGEGTFQPLVNLNRAQAVTFLYNLAGRPDVSKLKTREFSDVAASAWYYNAVKWAVANNITSGYGAGTFQPNALCTRAMIVTFLANYAKASGIYKETTTSSNFKDVAANAWYKASVDWAVANGITSGMGQGTFQPSAICNRAMMVAFLRKLSVLKR